MRCYLGERAPAALEDLTFFACVASLRYRRTNGGVKGDCFASDYRHEFGAFLRHTHLSQKIRSRNGGTFRRQLPGATSLYEPAVQALNFRHRAVDGQNEKRKDPVEFQSGLFC